MNIYKYSELTPEKKEFILKRAEIDIFHFKLPRFKFYNMICTNLQILISRLRLMLTV